VNGYTKTKVALSILMIVSLVLVYIFLLDYHSDDKDINTDIVKGQITFKLYDEFDVIIIDDVLDYYDNDSLYTILQRNYQVVCANQFYQRDETCSYRFINGYVILEIESVVSNWYQTVLTLYINGVRANYGVSLVDFKDGDLVEFKRTIYDE